MTLIMVFSKQSFLVLALCRLLDRVPEGTPFIVLCFITRSVDAVGFAAAMTSSFAVSAKVFPNNIATVLVSLAHPCLGGMLLRYKNHEPTKEHCCPGLFISVVLGELWS